MHFWHYTNTFVQFLGPLMRCTLISKRSKHNVIILQKTFIQKISNFTLNLTFSNWETYPWSSLVQRIPHRRCTVHPRSVHFLRSYLDNWRRCSLLQRNRWSTRICHPRSGLYPCSRRGTWAGCSLCQCSLHSRHSVHQHSGHCRCIRRGRMKWSSLDLPNLGYTYSCMNHAGRCHDHCS